MMEDTKRILAKGEIVMNNMSGMGRNNNDLVLATGTDAIECYVKPNIMAGNESLLVLDIDSKLKKQFTSLLEEKGYRILCIDLVDGIKSDFYNPIDLVEYDKGCTRLNESDIGIIADALMLTIATGEERMAHERMHEIRECLIPLIELRRLDCMCWFEGDEADGIVGVLEDVINQDVELKAKAISYRENAEGKAVMKLIESRSVIEKHLGVLCSLLKTLDKVERGNAHVNSGVYTGELAFEKTILFVNISGVDRSMDWAVSMIYSQAMKKISGIVNLSETGHLKYPVRFVIGSSIFMLPVISDFAQSIGNIQSKGISISLICQSLKQLYGAYGNASGQGIVDNCDTILYLGGREQMTVEYIVWRTGREAKDVLNKRVDEAYLIINGEDTNVVKKYEVKEHPDYPKTQKELVEPCGIIIDEFEADERAAMWGDVSAQLKLAKYHSEYGLRNAEGYKRSIYWYELLAKRGDASMQYQLAEMVMSYVDKEVYGNSRNRGGRRNRGDRRNRRDEPSDYNYKYVAEWFEQAAKQGYKDALYRAGYAYAQSAILIKNEGDYHAYRNRFNKTYVKAIDCWNKDVENGNVDSIAELANAYAFGFGVKQSDEKAVEFWELASEKGAIDEKYYEIAALSYESCKQGAYTDRKAVEYWTALLQNASDIDEIDRAKLKLGKCYFTGCGIDKSEENAIEMFESLHDERRGIEGLAACYKEVGRIEEGDRLLIDLYTEIIEEKDEIAEYMFDVEKSKNRKSDIFREITKITDQGDGQVWYLLGCCYARGKEYGVNPHGGCVQMEWGKAYALGNENIVETIKDGRKVYYCREEYERYEADVIEEVHVIEDQDKIEKVHVNAKSCYTQILSELFDEHTKRG